MATMWWCSVM